MKISFRDHFEKLFVNKKIVREILETIPSTLEKKFGPI